MPDAASQVAAGDQSLIAFLGVAPDRRLLGSDGGNLPDTEQHPEPPAPTAKHDRLVATGSALTGVTLVGGLAILLFGAEQLLFGGGGALAAVLAVLGALLVSTHWGWVHVAEYVGLTIDDHQQGLAEQREQDWLTTVAPYPRFSVTTDVLGDASTRVRRVLHQPVLTPEHTFTFVRHTDAETTFAADTAAEVIADTVETMRRQARLDTDRHQGNWEAAAAAYDAALARAEDDRQQLAAERAAARALSEHINASLREPPLIE